MKKNLALVAAKALPALSGSQFTYNVERNVFLSLGYTSAAGNTYYKAIRLSNRLAIYYDLGEGYAHTFLNGITLFCWDGTQARIIGQRSWGGYNWRAFSEEFAKEQATEMLEEYIAGQARLLGKRVSKKQLLSFASEMVNETERGLSA